jgi:sec-independent protein translocase protein TatB
MLGLSFEKIVILAAIAAFVIGPSRLPAYASTLARIARSARGLVEQAQLTVKDELGPEFADIEWKKLDPRQYDPRRIVRDALEHPLPTIQKAPDAQSQSGLAPSDDS